MTSDRPPPPGSAPLTAGDPAPDFILPDRGGEPVRLADLRGRRVLVYFYPRADTPGCTTQACSLRDAAPDLGDTVVVGISPDPPARLARFDDKHELRFTLLSDADHTVAAAYGAWGEKKMYGKVTEGIIRSAFLVGIDGTLEAAWYRISPKDTVPKLLDALATR